MPAKSVVAYRRAEEMGEKLAMSNLGNKLLSEGFVEEAQELCDQALATKNYHRNIGHLLARLKDSPDQEDIKEKDLIEKTKPKVEFYKSLGQAISQSEPQTLVKTWQGSNGMLDAKLLENNMVRFSGTYEREAGGLGLLGSSAEKQVWRVEYSGRLSGRAITGTVNRSTGSLSSERSEKKNPDVH
jgi:hypothetical protein